MTISKSTTWFLRFGETKCMGWRVLLGREPLSFVDKTSYCVWARSVTCILQKDCLRLNLITNCYRSLENYPIKKYVYKVIFHLCLWDNNKIEVLMLWCQIIFPLYQPCHFISIQRNLFKCKLLVSWGRQSFQSFAGTFVFIALRLKTFFKWSPTLLGPQCCLPPVLLPPHISSCLISVQIKWIVVTLMEKCF